MTTSVSWLRCLRCSLVVVVVVVVLLLLLLLLVDFVDAWPLGTTEVIVGGQS